MNFFNSVYGKKLIYLASYVGISFFFYVIFLSGIAFFHFLIDHSMMDIEAWVYDKNWTIFLLIKTMALFSIYQFLSVKLPTGTNLVTILSYKDRVENKIMVGILTLFFLTLVMVKPIFVDGKIILLSKVFIAYFSSFFLFSLDAIFVLLLEKIFPRAKNHDYPVIIIYSLFFSALNYFQFGSKIEYLPFLLTIHFFNFYLIIINLSFKSLLYFNLFLTAPFIALVGLDPIWGSGYSILEPQMRISWLNMSVLILIVLGYWKWRENKNDNSGSLSL